MGVLPFMSSGYGKQLFAKITTMDADLERIVIEQDSTGRQLFDTVCRIIGLREIWYFGLQYTNKKGIPCWLQMDKKILKQDVPKSEEGYLHFLFLVKFYPEDVEEELIQDLTRHLFFLQIKQAILGQDLYCSAEAAVLLASYAVQAINGDCNEQTELDLTKLLPVSVTEQYDMSEVMWQERIRRWWTNNAGQSREDAQMEYLRVAQDLEMYGIQYYPICNKKETDLQLGVSAQGIGIYKGTNRITPRPFFSWSEIKNISFKNKKFNMKTVDKSTISFSAQDHSINMSILDLCIGTHNLYLRRRQPDLLEVQQMKAQAKEERIRRQEEQERLMREREERLQAEAERNRLKNELQSMAEQLLSTKEQMRKTEETAELLAEKARVSETETLQLAKRAQDAEAECHRIKMSHVKCEEIRMRMERKVHEAESYAQRLSLSIGELHRRPLYSSHAHISDQNGWSSNGFQQPPPQMSMSHHQLMISSSSQDGEREMRDVREHKDIREARENRVPPYRPTATQPMPINQPGILPPPPIPITSAMALPTNLTSMVGTLTPPTSHNIALPPPDPSAYISGMPPEIVNIRNELEKSRSDYNEKTRHFKEKLEEFRSEIEGLKKEERVTEQDRAHAQNIQRGLDKIGTLRMSQSGSAKSRVEVFEGL